MLVVLDNRDSFVWNLVQALEALGAEVRVLRAPEVDLAAVVEARPARLVIGPGPGGPADARTSLDALEHFAGRIPILGVCLGLQVVALRFGARVVRGEPVHGHASRVEHDARGLFRGIASPLTVGRYHSLRVESASLPDVLEASAWSEDGALMGLRHREHPIEAVQFHPESILSEPGDALLANFLRDA
ncbi:MAG: aminodeoxychorismate/anthranilate synthase component II [Planctomycetes bacterium]|nr:aminodeoxychorismate/anthranilate synthase component II [Planctomycetota bacterium]